MGSSFLRLRARAGIGRSVNRFRPERGSSHLGSEHFLVHGNILQDETAVATDKNY
jgi:hypothetical protein